MLTKEDIKVLLEEEREHTAKIIDQKLEPINKKLDNLTFEVPHIKTAIKYLATQEDTDLEVEKVGSEILSAVLALRVKVLQIHKNLTTSS